MLEAITLGLGIFSTLVAWFFNPKRLIYSELDSIYKELERKYEQRDKAIIDKNTDDLTIISNRIIQLCERKSILFQRLG